MVCLVHSNHTTKYVMQCSTGGKDFTLHEILSSHMPCFLALFRNANVQHHFDKSIPQSAIPKPTSDFVQGNGSDLKLKHNAQPATIHTNYQLFTNLLHPRAVGYQAHCWQHRRHC
jgi:hypothetical protein